ncbi:hypothetical protein HYH03_000859 [Edaphochlamys debaryana]|uniref:Uncharacterized protein n=1 Tax=Edaphochlamys debaryana TaxID=47281 RepID=A0A836C5M3_9CHLO|nr:hypothetical protein HYH03_000859 [Edaphochlamys debaryana]|eukprot:KAG2501040.1 hypothetical protein HYH03_000859 [Edaphochlamys debaryana]
MASGDASATVKPEAVEVKVDDSISTVVAELKKANDELKKANKKDPKPVPTGVTPRGFLLPVLVLCIMTPILIGICLPASLVQKYNAFSILQDASTAIPSPPSPPSPPNPPSPPARQRPPRNPVPAGMFSRPPTPPPPPPSPPVDDMYKRAYENLVKAEGQYFNELMQTCNVVGRGLWGKMSDDDFSSSSAGATWLQAIQNVEPVYASTKPPSAVASPPPPPDSDAVTAFPPGFLSGDYEGMPVGMPQEPDSPDTPDSPDSPIGPPAVPPPRAPPTPAPAPPPSAIGAGTGTISVLRRKVSQFTQAVAAWATVNATVTALDVAVNSATVSFEMRVGSAIFQTAKKQRQVKRSARALAKVQYPALLDRTGRIKAKDVLLKTDVVSSSASGADSTLTLKSGDRVFTRKMDIPLTPTTSLYMYPFDEYTGTVTMVTTLAAGDINYPTALIVQQKNAVVGWTLQASIVPTIEENRNVYNFTNPLDPDSAVTLTYTIKLKRTTFVQFFAVFVLIGLWLVSSCSFCYAMDLLYIRPRNATNGDATLFTAQLFAVVGTRNIMPGVPAVGVGVDFFGIIWIMIICLFTGAMVYARVVSQYVHKEPTVYDKVLKNQVWQDGWLAAKEADKKAKKAKKDAEEERAKLIKEHGAPPSSSGVWCLRKPEPKPMLATVDCVSVRY